MENRPFAASHSHGTKPLCWRAKVTLGQDKQKTYIILNGRFLCLSCPSVTFAREQSSFVPCEWLAPKGLMHILSLFLILANKKFDYFGQYCKHTFQLKAGRSEHFTQLEQKTNNYLAQSIKLIKLNRPHVYLKKTLSKKEFLLTEHVQRLLL